MKRRTIVFVLALFAIGVVISAGLNRLESLRPVQVNSFNPAGPQRVICAAPNIVEIVYALGQQDRIAGVSNYANYPPEARLKESIGGVIDPNTERILALKPDLIIAQGAMEKLAALCRRKGIPFLRVDMETLGSIFDGIRSIGNALGCPDKAVSLAEGIQTRLNRIQDEAAAIGHRPKVFLCMGRRAGSLSSLITMSGETFFDELLQIAGGDNIFMDASARYPQISKESLLLRAPEVILEFRMEENAPALAEDIMKDWRAMPMLPAVASGRIYPVTDDYIMISGPRIDWTAQRFFDLIHAE